jgi:hypothetical protein
MSTRSFNSGTGYALAVPWGRKAMTGKAVGGATTDGFGWIAYPVRPLFLVPTYLSVLTFDPTGFNYLAFDIIGQSSSTMGTH